MNAGPIVVIDDDQDDHELIEQICVELDITHPMEHFIKSDAALEYLRNTDIIPLVIICDVNMPKMNGFEIRQHLMSDLKQRYTSIPFVFWSNTASEEQIKKSYDSGGHGFFIKEARYQALKRELKIIVEYWELSKTPGE